MSGKTYLLIWVLSNPRRLKAVFEKLIKDSWDYIRTYQEKQKIKRKIETRKGWHEDHSKVKPGAIEHRVPPIHFIKKLRNY